MVGMEALLNGKFSVSFVQMKLRICADEDIIFTWQKYCIFFHSYIVKL